MAAAESAAGLAVLQEQGWHVWRGVSGLVYASLPRSSPPGVLRGESITELAARAAGWKAAHK